MNIHLPNPYLMGQIYRLTSVSRPDLCYYGSTIKPLQVRWNHHKSKQNKSSSKQIIELGDAIIELVEAFPCTSRRELHFREGEYIQNNPCVNKNIAGHRIDTREYYQANKERIKKTALEYHYAHRAEHLQQMKINNAKRLFFPV